MWYYIVVSNINLYLPILASMWYYYTVLNIFYAYLTDFYRQQIYSLYYTIRPLLLSIEHRLFLLILYYQDSSSIFTMSLHSPLWLILVLSLLLYWILLRELLLLLSFLASSLVSLWHSTQILYKKNLYF